MRLRGWNVRRASSESSYSTVSALLPPTHRSSAGASLGGLMLLTDLDAERATESVDKKWKKVTRVKVVWLMIE